MASEKRQYLEKFSVALERVAEKMPDLRRELNTRLAEMAKEELDMNILSTGVHDTHSHIRDWQVIEVGSGGGYGAVHPAPGSGPDSPAAITRYLDDGRRRYYPHTRTDYESPTTATGWVDGHSFYHKARLTMMRKAVELAEQAMRDIAKQIGG